LHSGTFQQKNRLATLSRKGLLENDGNPKCVSFCHRPQVRDSDQINQYRMLVQALIAMNESQS
jgi:hypothetical protein